MSEPKVLPQDYMDVLIASPKHCTATEAAKCQPDLPDPPAHDAFTRLLHRLEPDPEALGLEAQTQVVKPLGVLVIDDSMLDKPYARSIDLVTRLWSGKHHAVVAGINLVTLLWTDGDRHIPCTTVSTTRRTRGPRTITSPQWFGSLISGVLSLAVWLLIAGPAAWRI